MYAFSVFKTPLFVAMLAALTAADFALADRGDRGGRGGGGGGGGGGGSSSRSFSGGGGGSRSGSGMSSRSFSGGGGGGSSVRSFSGGSRSSSIGSSGNSSRSFSPSSRPSFSGGSGSGPSARSFSGGSSFSRGNSGSSSRSLGSGNNGSSSRSFSGGGNSSVRSYLGNNSGNNPSSSSFSRRSTGNSTSNIPQVLGNSVRGSDSPRSFSNNGRSNQSGNSDNGRSRFFGGSNSNNNRQSVVTGPSSSRTGQGDASQNTFRRQGSSQQANGSTNVDRSRLNSFLNGRSGTGGNQGAGNSLQTGNNQNQVGQNQNGQGSRHYAGRLTDDQVRNFLNMRGNANARIADNGPGNNGGDRRNGGNLQDRLGNQVGGKPDGDNNRFTNGDNNGRGNGPRLGNGDRNGKDGKDLANIGNGRENFFKNRDNDGKNNLANVGDGRDNFFKNRDRDGKFDNDGRGNFNGRGDGNFGNGKNGDFRGGDSARRSYDNWKDSWKGKHGDGRDHRDWSGKWRDGDRFDVANNIRGNWWNRRDYDRFPFRGGWWGGYNNWGRYNNWGWGRNYGWRFWDDYCVRYNRPWYWWSWTTAPVLTNWCDFGWSTPYYWDYGPNEYIYANNGVVYVNGAWYQPAPVFYQQTVQMIDQAPIPAADAAAQVEWLPLGVFAVTPDGMNEPDVMAQLAVTKDGIIGGTVNDQKANKSYSVTGTVDKNSQRAVWSYTNDQNVRVVMETSVNNLTQNESTGLVHYGPDDQRVIELVRLQDPSNPNEQLPAPPQGGAQQNVAKPPALVPPQAPPQAP